MNIQFSTQSSAGTLFEKSAFSNKKSENGPKTGTASSDASKDPSMSERLKNMGKTSEPKRDSKGRIIFAEDSNYKKNGFWDYSSALKDNIDKATPKKSKYNYKDISGAIQQAKNSDSAGKVVIKAKRAVIDLKRKIASADNDEEKEELCIALNHAKRMERVAKKKQHNLENEEMVTIAHKNDPEKEDGGSGYDDLRGALTDLGEEEIFDAQAAIDKEQTEYFCECTAEMTSEDAELLFSLPEESDLMTGDAVENALLDELNALFEDFGSEEQQMLSEAMEALEAAEIVDPHMSEEELEKLKTRHRNSEEREIVKANMDYLKETIKHLQKSDMSAGAISPAPAIAAPAFPISIEGTATAIDTTA